MSPALLSSARINYLTPPRVLRLVRSLGPIGLDPAAAPNSFVRARTEWTKGGLELPWWGLGLVFVNPPYGRTIGKWASKVQAEATNGQDTEIVGLWPARTDTKWWSLLVGHGGRACFLRGRLRFVGEKHPAPFPSVVTYHGPRDDLFEGAFFEEGWIADLSHASAHGLHAPASGSLEPWWTAPAEAGARW